MIERKRSQSSQAKKGMQCPNRRKEHNLPNQRKEHNNPLTKQLKTKMDGCWNLGIGLEHNYKREMFLLINTINDRLLSKKRRTSHLEDCHYDIHSGRNMKPLTKQ